MISVTRKSNFNAAHRLHNPNWSDEENEQFYGLCNNKNYHGHNYELEVTITGTIDSESGYLIDLNYWEFWQGRKNRTHDRFSYSKVDKGWKIKRLSP